MAGAVAAHLIALLRSRVNLASAQANAGLNRDQLFERQFFMLADDFSKARGLDLDGMTSVTHEIAAGPWSSEQKQRLAAALEAASLAGGKKAKLARPQQTCD